MCGHAYVSACVLALIFDYIHFVLALKFVPNLIGEEGKVHLPHFKYAEL